MDKSIIFISIIFLLISTSCDKEEIGDPNYPTLVKTIGSRELDNRFSQIINSPIYGCTLLNDFGFFASNLRDTKMCQLNDTVEAIYTRDELIIASKSAAVRYASFLGITDTSLMKAESVSTMRGVSYDAFRTANPDSFPPLWRMVFHPQNVEGMEVRGTIISMIIDCNNVVAIHGNWFENIYIPEVEKYNESKAKELLINQKLTYKNRTFTPNEETLWRSIKKVVVPLYRSGQIELRICHALYSGSWEILVDTQTGERLSSVDLNAL